MDTDAGVRKLVELIFGKKPTIREEMKAHSSIPSCLLNDDFSKRLTKVLDIRRRILAEIWKNHFDRSLHKLLTSHMPYIILLMNSCLCENLRNKNSFDSFISVCCLLSNVNEETVSKVGVDFRDLNPDVFMVLFRSTLSSCFSKRKDFNRFVEYILDHRYLKLFDDSTSQERYSENMRREIDSYRALQYIPGDKLKAVLFKGASLASEVLSLTAVKLPDLPTENELIKRLVDYKIKEREEEAEKKRKDEIFLTSETSPGRASFNSDSKANLGKHQGDTPRHESIIEAVIRHNRLKNSGQETANTQSYEEANGILENLKSKIKSLIEVLDECYE